MKNLDIHIKALGPIKNAHIELAPVMFFTGASNLGKSYTNFLTYYVFNLFSSDRLKDFISSRIINDQKDTKFFRLSFTEEDLCLWMKEDVKRFFIYLLNYPDVPCDIDFKFSEKNKAFTVSYTRDLHIKEAAEEYYLMVIGINNTRHIAATAHKNRLQTITLQIARYLGKALLDISIRYSYLLPPGRASLLNESFTTQSQSSKTGMYDIFMRDFDRINNLKMNNVQESQVQENLQTANSIQNLIEGDLSYNKEGVVLKMKDKTEVPLSAAASSIKELSPLLLWMQTNNYGKDSMCIEEPEAHAHPDMQYQIADLLTSCINKGAFMQITTHSDYLLARLNQLIRLHNLKLKNEQEFNRICQKYHLNQELTLDKRKIKAYYFHKDKETKGIIIEKQNLEDGIPFTTFSNAVQEQISWDEVLNNIN